MSAGFHQRLQRYRASQKYLAIKVRMAAAALIASVLLFILALLFSHKLGISDALALIPVAAGFVPVAWFLRHGKAADHFGSEVVQEFKLRVASRKDLSHIKFAVCDFVRDLFAAEATKLQIHNSIPVLWPARADFGFEQEGRIAWLTPEVDRGGHYRKIVVGRLGNEGPYPRSYVTKVRIELTRDHHLGQLLLVTKEKLSLDDEKLLSQLEDQIDTWIANGVERYQAQLVVNLVRALDEIANRVDAGEGDLDALVPALLSAIARETSSSSAYGRLFGRPWAAKDNAQSWTPQQWDHIEGLYNELKERIGLPGHEHVERCPVPWGSAGDEVILIPVYFDETAAHLGYVALQSQEYEVGIEKALAHVEDLVLDNLVQRLGKSVGAS